MGYNATVVVLLDALHDIERDPEFGKKLSAAISKVSCYSRPVDVSAMNFCNAAQVIETHHADQFVGVLVGGNTGLPMLGSVGYRQEELELAYLRELAHAHGFNLSKKRVSYK